MRTVCARQKKVCVRIAIFACTDRLRVCELRFCECVCCRITAASLAQLVYSTFIRIPRPLFAPSVPNMAQTGVPGIRWPPSEDCRRKNAIEQNGQPVVLRVACLGELLAIALEPGSGFIHLVQDHEACIEAYGPYHLSVCQMGLVSGADVAELRARWDGVQTTLAIAWCGRGGYMELADNPLTDDQILRRLHFHPNAWYAHREWHISG